MLVARQALYRTYRPHRFREVVGQDAEVRLLKEAVRLGQLSHAYLLSGPRGTGKTSVARILAQAATCEAPEDGEPCGSCASCQAAENQSHLDIIEIDGASNRGIDEVRDLRERILHAPAMGRRKVYIVDEVHMLTEAAFNAFLKTLEEPPPHVLFIFATTEPHKLPITVLSRCQRYDFQRIGAADIARQLAYIAHAEGVEADAEALDRIAEASDGGLRDAESLLDQALAGGGPVTTQVVEDLLGALDQRQLTELVDTMVAGDLAGVLTRVDALYQAGRDPRQMLRDVARRLRDVWAGALLDATRSWTVGSDCAFQALDALAEAEGRLRGSFPPRLVIELGILKASQALSGRPEDGEPPATGPARQAPPADPPAARPEPVQSAAAAPTQEAAPAPTGPGGDRPPAPTPEGGSVSLERVLDLLRKRRQLTAALFRHAVAEGDGEALTIRFLYPAHYAMLDDEASGHRQAFIDCFREVYGDRPVQFRLTAQESDPSPLDRIRAVFGDDVPVRVKGSTADGRSGAR
jgi:DNA polymerase-3 subunit gamma/tau